MKLLQQQLHVLSFGLVFAVGSTGLAQNMQKPREIGVEERVSIQSQAHGLSRAEGRLFGLGPDYRAEFDADGIEFVPALGRQAPHAMPLRFTFESVRRGDAVVHEAANAEPRQQDDYRVTFARGGGVTERYDVRVDGVEQSFVFDHPLPGNGDLVVRGALSTELGGQTGVYRDGMRFSCEHGAVTIGKVTGIDAIGSRVQGSLRYDGEHLDLVLPDFFVANARYPLVLDPLMGGVSNVNLTSSDDSNADSAYEGFHNRYCLVWERALAGDLIDIRAQRVNTSGGITGAVLLVKASGVNLAPSIASVRQTQTFVCAWQTSNNILGPFDIEARTIASVNGLMSTNHVAVGTQFQDNDVGVDVGGDRTTDSPDSLLVWQVVGQGLRGVNVRALSPPTDPTFNSVMTVSSNANDMRPAISKSGGDNGRWLIVWQRNGTVRMRVRDRQFNAITSGFLVDDGAWPDVDGNGNNFAIVYQQPEDGPGSGAPFDIHCRIANYNGGSSISFAGPGSPVEADNNQEEIRPFVCFIESKYLVGWTNVTGFLFSNISLRTIDPENCDLCGAEYDISGSNEYEFGATAASRWSGGDATDECIVSFSSGNNTPPWSSDMHAVIFEAIGFGGLVSDLGGECANGGFFQIAGAFALGNTVDLQLVQADTNAAFGALHIGNSAPAFACGPCNILLPFVGVSVAPVNGVVSTPLTIGCSTELLGQSLDFQYVIALTAVTDCSLIPNVGVSNILRATFSE